MSRSLVRIAVSQRLPCRYCVPPPGGLEHGPGWDSEEVLNQTGVPKEGPNTYAEGVAWATPSEAE